MKNASFACTPNMQVEWLAKETVDALVLWIAVYSFGSRRVCMLCMLRLRDSASIVVVNATKFIDSNDTN